MNKYLYKREIEKQAGLGAMAGKFLASGAGKIMSSAAGKAAVKGAGKAAVGGAVIGAASPVQTNPDGTKGSRIKNAIGGAIGGAAVGGVMGGASTALKSSLSPKTLGATKTPSLANSKLPQLGNSSTSKFTPGPTILPDGTIKVAREELYRSYISKYGTGV